MGFRGESDLEKKFSYRSVSDPSWPDALLWEYGFGFTAEMIALLASLKTSTEYDPVGRVRQVTDPVGAVTEYGYDLAGHQVSTTSPVGAVTRYAYDAAGQLVQVTEGADATAADGPDTNVVTAYTYTPVGLLESITDPLGARTTFTYDAAGRQTGQVRPGVETTVTYDSAGRVARVSNGAGVRAIAEYWVRLWGAECEEIRLGGGSAGVILCATNRGPGWSGTMTLGDIIITDAWIDGWYNARRRHSAIGYISPLEYEHRQLALAA